MSKSVFESIMHISEDGEEYWYARELQKALEYSKWSNFVKVIEKAKTACKNAANDVELHFADVGKMVEIGVSVREIEDMKLTRYACYLIVQNGDPRKEVIALGQTYFAVKTREQELSENFEQLSEKALRLHLTGCHLYRMFAQFLLCKFHCLFFGSLLVHIPIHHI